MMVLEDGVDQLLAECMRRDRAVGAGSKRTLILPGYEGREQLALSVAPMLTLTEDLVSDFREAFAKELRAIKNGAYDVRRARSGEKPDTPEHEIAREAMARLQAA